MQAAKGILLYSPSLPCLFRGSLLYHEEIKAIGIRKYTACIIVVSLTISSCVSVRCRDIEHAGSLESTKEA